METPRRRRADRFELAIIGSFIINVIYLILVATGLLRTDGSGLKLPLPLNCNMPPVKGTKVDAASLPREWEVYPFDFSDLDRVLSDLFDDGVVSGGGTGRRISDPAGILDDMVVVREPVKEASAGRHPLQGAGSSPSSMGR